MTDPGADLRALVARALAEDAADEDLTTRATVPAAARGVATLVARQACVVAGTPAFEEAFRLLDEEVRVAVLKPDGSSVDAGTVVALVEGRLRPILSAERTALNFVQRLSGVATMARVYSKAAGTVTVLDTRKTTPGLRALEKAAVAAGGATNHRATLRDAILVKDNHLAAAGGVAAAVAAARAAYPGMPVQVECDTLEQVEEAMAARADAVLLDNMDIPTLEKAVRLVDGRARTEASGGITLETIAEVAATGVDSISVGALTHSAPAVDLTLEIEAR